MKNAGGKVGKWESGKAGDGRLTCSLSHLLTCGLLLLLALPAGAQTSAIPVNVVLMLPNNWVGQTYSGMTFNPTNQGRTLILWPCTNCGGSGTSIITQVTIAGITNLNGSTNDSQTFVVGTSGNDFNIVTLAGVHTFNLPTASATVRGALSSADWTTFNSKSNHLVQTNGVDLGSAGTVNWTAGVTGYVSGSVLHLGVTATGGGGGFITNQYTTNIAGTPVVGSFWFGGTNGTAVTNGPRVGMEWIPVMRSWRLGEIGDGIHPSNLGGQGTNYWNATNIGVMSVGFGSNALVKANFSTVSGGRVNLILANSDNSTISGGYNNFIDTNSVSSTIGGGGFNQLYGQPTTHQNSFRTIGGGSNNIVNGSFTRGSTIGGGGDNLVAINLAGYGTIAGGLANQINAGGDYSFIGGGNQNTVNASSAGIGGAAVAGGIQNKARGDFSFIGGGKANNLLASDDDGCFIGGGSSNTVGIAAGDNDSKYASIVGGFQNSMAQNATFSFIGGGLLNTMGGNNTNSFIGGGFLNDIQANAQASGISYGLRNVIDGNGDFGQILGGVSNYVGASFATAIGHTITNLTERSIELGVTNANKVRVDRTNTWLLGDMRLRMTNGAGSGKVLTSDATGEGTWQAPTGGTTPGGEVAHVQVHGTGGTFVGSTGMVYHVTNQILYFKQNGAGTPLIQLADIAAPNATNEIGPQWIRMNGPHNYGIGNYGSNNWFFTSEGHLRPVTTNAHDLGETLYPVRTAYIQTNAFPFEQTTNDYVLNQYYTNSAQRSWVAAAISLTNQIAGDKSHVALYLDQDADGTWERTGLESRLQGVALASASHELSAFVQPLARFIFTNFTAGSGAAAIVANSSQWIRQ